MWPERGSRRASSEAAASEARGADDPGRTFLTSQYTNLKELNPGLNILVRDGPSARTALWAVTGVDAAGGGIRWLTYAVAEGKELKFDLENKSASDVEAALKTAVQSAGDGVVDRRARKFVDDIV